MSKFLISRDVTFDESIMLKARDGAPEPASKEDEKVEKMVEFEVPVQKGDKIMSHDGAHLEEEEKEEEEEGEEEEGEQEEQSDHL
jgi:hypothetical protein